jgi:hypothetical protein
MLVINEQRSGAVDPTKIALANMPMGTSPKLVITIDGDSLEEVQSSEAKSQAMARAAQEGYGQGGLADMRCMQRLMKCSPRSKRFSPASL